MLYCSLDLAVASEFHLKHSPKNRNYLFFRVEQVNQCRLQFAITLLSDFSKQSFMHVWAKYECMIQIQ